MNYKNINKHYNHGKPCNKKGSIRDAREMRRHELRADVAEWFTTASLVDSSSELYVLTVVQRPGSWERRTITQEYKNISVARVESTRLLAEVLADCGARSFSVEIGDDKFTVTTDNRFKITLVLE